MGENQLKLKKNPTPRQIKAFEAVLRNLEKEQPESLKAVLESVGYGKALQDQPNRVIESEGFQKLLAEHLPYESLTKKHKELLNAINFEKISFSEQDSDEEIAKVISQMEGYKLLKVKDIWNHDRTRITERIAYVKAPNVLAQDKALDKAYKLRGDYVTPEEPTSKAPSQVNYNFIFSSDVQDKIKAINNVITEKLVHAQTS